MRAFKRLLIAAGAFLIVAALAFALQWYGYRGGFSAGQAQSQAQVSLLQQENQRLSQALEQAHAALDEARAVSASSLQAAPAGAAEQQTPFTAPPQNTPDNADAHADVSTQPAATTNVSAGNISETDGQTDGYIGNVNSKKFHLPTCKNLPSEQNRILFAAREEAIEQGYTPCGNCNP